MLCGPGAISTGYLQPKAAMCKGLQPWGATFSCGKLGTEMPFFGPDLQRQTPGLGRCAVSISRNSASSPPGSVVPR